MSESYYQIQYTAYTEPVPLAPSDQVDRAGFPHWVQPPQQVEPVEYRYSLDSFFFLEQSIITPPAAAPELSWFQPASQPVLPVDRRNELGEYAFVNNPDLQVNPTWFPQWMREIDQPVLPIEYRHQLDSVFDSPWEEIISTDSGVNFPTWVQPVQMPVLPVEYRHLLPSTFFVGEPSDFTVVVVPDYGWYRPADQPVLPEDRRHELGAFSFVNNPDLQVNPTWFPQWVAEPQVPVVDPEYRHILPYFFGLGEPIPTPSATPDFGWYQPSENPVLPAEYRHLFPYLFTSNQPIVPFGWFRPTDEPVLGPEYRHLLESYFDPANWEAIISTDSGVNFPSWMQPVSQPVLPVEYRYLLPSVFRQIDPDDFVAAIPFTATFSIRATLQDLRSAVLATGYVADCDIGQPLQINTDRVHAALWAQSTAIPEVSLSTTQHYYLITIRFYTDAFGDPEEMETMLAQAVSSSWVNWLADYDVGATARAIDVAGMYGSNLTARWGHESIGGRMFRVADVTLPLIVNDVGTLTQ